MFRDSPGLTYIQHSIQLMHVLLNQHISVFFISRKKKSKNPIFQSIKWFFILFVNSLARFFKQILLNFYPPLRWWKCKFSICILCSMLSSYTFAWIHVYYGSEFQNPFITNFAFHTRLLSKNKKTRYTHMKTENLVPRY